MSQGTHCRWWVPFLITIQVAQWQQVTHNNFFPRNLLICFREESVPIWCDKQKNIDNLIKSVRNSGDKLCASTVAPEEVHWKLETNDYNKFATISKLVDFLISVRQNYSH